MQGSCKRIPIVIIAMGFTVVHIVMVIPMGVVVIMVIITTADLGFNDTFIVVPGSCSRMIH